MYTLGINAAYHDSAACLVRDGRILSAAEEERFTRIKHGKRPTPFSTYELPFNAIDYCLAAARVTLNDIDNIAYSYDPYLLLGRHAHESTLTLPLEPSANFDRSNWEAPWDPLFLASIVNAPRHLVGGVPHHLQQRLHSNLAQVVERWNFIDHHLAHAASAYIPSPFERAAILILDGRGERASTSFNIGSYGRIERIKQVDAPHSLGLLYEEVTRYLGFLNSSDEYKVMALASYGEPRYARVFRDVIHLYENDAYTIEPLRLEERFGPGRKSGAALCRQHFDIARSIQAVLEETVLELSRWLRQASDCDVLCMAGGVALNCVLNTKIRESGSFRKVWVQPAASDAGTALGAALLVDARQQGKMKVRRTERFGMENAYLGPEYTDSEIEELLHGSGLSYSRLADVPRDVAEILIKDKIIGWFQARMEFGPRALGARSILASPLSSSMQSRLNTIKDREDFRPVAPSVLEEEADNWFVDVHSSPFMMFTYKVRPERAGQIPAVCHIDGTARIQTVKRSQNLLYHDLLQAFHVRTGVPILVNTSFNTRGEPIVCSPRDALECFWTSPLDALVIGSFLVEKSKPTPESSQPI
jgi:carbamoyltransferase